MASRVGIALAVCLVVASSSWAQVVRFETSVGHFDMVLNPTNNPLLDEHTENMLKYAQNGNYNGSWINRADEGNPGSGGFVLQMGGFFSHTLRPALTVASTRPVADFGDVTGSPRISGLSNTRGTVSLALSGSDPNSGSSSFFINLGSNTSLDNQFTVFAAISDMTTVDTIMGLTQQDLTDPARQPAFGGDPTTFGNVPIQANGFQVFIKRAFVVSDAMTVAMATGSVETTMAVSAGLLGEDALESGGSGGAGFAGLGSTTVPEPTSFLVALTGLAVLSLWRGNRRAR